MNSRLSTFPSAVIFDLDGTLIDSAPDLQAALNRLLAKEGRRVLAIEEVVRMIGDGIYKLVERGYEATGEIPPSSDLDERVAAFSEDYEKRATEKTKLFDGVEVALQRLKDNQVKLGICTNKPQAATQQVLKHFQLSSFFNAVVGGDQLGGIRKPDPRHLQAAIDRLDVSGEETIMVGDSPNDIQVAINAGIPSVAVSFGYRRVAVEDMGATQIINHFDELPAALKSILASKSA